MADKIMTMPNGEPVNFGDLPDHRIRELIERKFPGAFTTQGSDALETVLPSVARLGINTIAAPGNIRELGGSALDYAGSLLGIPAEKRAQMGEAIKPALGMTPMGGLLTHGPTTGELQPKVEEAIGTKLYEPKTLPGRLVDKTIQFGPGLFAGPGGVLGRAVTNVGVPTAASEAGGSIAANWGEGARPYGEAVGGMFSGKVTKPMPRVASSERLRQVGILEREGITPLAGQVLNSRRLMAHQSELGGYPVQEAAIRQKENFTRAALRRVGIENESYATPEVMKANIERMGQEFDDLGRGNTFIPTKNLHNEVSAIGQQYSRRLSKMLQSPIIGDYVREIKSLKAGSKIPGANYAALRERLAADIRGAQGSDKKYLGDILESLDDAMEKNISPALAARWKKVRREYRNNFAIEKAINAEHFVAPSALRTAARTQGRRGFVAGKNDFTELSDAGSALLKEVPSSFTSERLMARLAPVGGQATVGGGIGATAGHFLGIDPFTGAAIGGIGLPALKAGYSRALASPQTQQWLMGRAAKGDPTAVSLLQGMQTAGKLSERKKPAENKDDLWERALELYRQQSAGQ